MTDPAPVLPARIFDFLAALERPFRFLIGMGLIVREVVVYASPRPWALVLCATLSGTSLTGLADEARRALRKDEP